MKYIKIIQQHNTVVEHGAHVCDLPILESVNICYIIDRR